MRTDAGPVALSLTVAVAASVVAAPARAEPTDDGGWIAAFGIEVSVIGASVGPRAEISWRPGPPGTVSHLRASAGVLLGPELTFVPIGLGYRALWRADRTVQPFAGGGWENQHFVISDAPTVHRWLALYAEGGCAFQVRPDFTLGIVTSVDLALLRDVGVGLQLRGFGTWRF